jgi:hypothetical protein
MSFYEGPRYGHMLNIALGVIVRIVSSGTTKMHQLQSRLSHCLHPFFIVQKCVNACLGLVPLVNE